MRTKILYVILALAALFVPAAAAGVIIGKTSITARAQHALFFKAGAQVVVSGQLQSSKAFCSSNRVVRLRSTSTGVSRQLRAVRTDRQGKYRFVLHPRKPERVYVYFAGVFQSSYGAYHRCLASRSRSITVRPAQA